MWSLQVSLLEYKGIFLGGYGRSQFVPGDIFQFALGCACFLKRLILQPASSSLSI